MHVLAPHISCVCGPHELAGALEQGFKEVYVITAKGVIKHHQLRGENRFVRLKVATIPGYQEIEINPALSFLPAGKIPYTIYEQVLGFFRKVMAVKNSEVEAMIHVLYNAERGYHLGVPPQTISKASVSYDWSYIPQGTSIIVDIHSHNTMGAFFSGTDNNDDRNNVSYSGVFGKLKDKEPATVWRFNYFNEKYEASADDLFDLPIIPETEIPAEWLDQVKIQTYAVGYQGGNRGQGNVGPGTPNSWDHLKQYQYKPGLAKNQNGIRNETSSHNEHLYGGEFAEFFGHGLEEYPDDALGLFPHNLGRPVAKNPESKPGAKWRYSPDTQEKSLAVVTEDPTAGDPLLGKQDGGQDSSHLAPDSSIDDITGGQFESLANLHGMDVAEAWFAISMDMVTLDGKDDINADLISDMFNLTSTEGQVKIFKELYEQLPKHEKEKIEMYGI